MSVEEYGEEIQPRSQRRRQSIEERAERPELKLLARINMAVVTPALLIGISGMAAFIWKGMEDDRRDNKQQTQMLDRSFNDLRATIDGIVKYQIPGTVQLFDSRFNAQANRIDELGKINERQDRDIQELRSFRFGGSK